MNFLICEDELYAILQRNSTGTLKKSYKGKRKKVKVKSKK